MSGLTAKLADQTFELSNAVAEPCILVDIWIIPRNDEVVLGERVDKYETCTDLILGSSISETQRPVCGGRGDKKR